MHHCTYADSRKILDLDIVLLADIVAQVSVAILETIPNSLDAVCPETINELVFPRMATLSDRSIILVDENRLDAGGAKLDTEDGFTLLYSFFCCHLLDRLEFTY